MGLEPGYLVSKHVKLVRLLKGGGMGAVWVADHLALHSQVAVKFILGNHQENPAYLARFTREATSAARIKSPHVVQIHDHGVTDEGAPFMIMELLEGEDLSCRLKRKGPLPLLEVATIVQQTCRVLAKAHKLGIVHRDIKPSNIFLVDTDGDTFVKLLDFGVAKLGHDENSELTTTGVMVGTMVYMSPEQLLDARRVDHRADLWSLAVVAYRAITGQLPFKDENGLGALVLALDRGIFPKASELLPELPPSVDAFFAKTFERKPEDRYQSAREMAEDLFIAIGQPDAMTKVVPSRHSAPTLAKRPDSKPAIDAQARMTRPELPPKKREDDEDGVLRPSQKPTVMSSSGGAGSIAARAEDPGTVGGTSVAGLIPRRRSMFRRYVVGAGLVLAVAAATVVWLHPERFRPSSPSRVATGSIATSQAPSAPVTPPSDVATTEATTTPEPSAVQSADVAPSASAAASSSARAGLKGRIPPTQQRPPGKTEKDYGF